MAKQQTTPRSINKRQVQVILIVSLILISMFFSIYFRSYPATLPVADVWAENTIQSGVRQQVTAAVNQQYPNLPADRKAPLIEEQVALVLKDQKDAYAEQKTQQAQFIRDRLQKDDGQTYLIAIDPYYYLRRVENVIETDTVCDEMNEDVCWDDHVVAPVGKPTTEEYHTRFSALIYNIVKIFKKDAVPFNVFFWIPVIISSLAVIPAFFITRKRAGILGGFIAAMIVAVHGTFLGRTAAGFADTDGYNVTFPLLIFWMFIEAFEAKDLKKKLIYSGITGLTLGIYSKIWSGWWYIFDFMLVTIIVYLIYTIIKSWLKTRDLKKSITTDETKHAGISILGILVSSGIFVSLFLSFKNFIGAPLSAIRFTSIQNAAKIDLWPNVYTTVAELNRANLGSIVNQIGGSALFYLACLGLIVTLISVKDFRNKDWVLLGGGAFVYLLLITGTLLAGNPYIYLALLLLPVAYGLISLLKDKRDIDIKYAIFLVVWFAGSIYASTQGVRFILMIVPAYAVAIGILIGQLYRLIISWTTEQWDIDQTWIKATLVIIALLILVNPITTAHQTAQYEVPSMNDAWWDSLTKINEEAAPDAIVNSWWDFGHWFKYVADRATTFDGTNQNTPMAHWIGRALSTESEEEALGILRMLDCGSRTGFDALTMSIQEVETVANIKPETTVVARALMDEIILIKNQEEAKEYLVEQGINEADAENITALTHCTPPENYLITSGDMVGKASVWGHFGAWDFRKAYVYNILREEMPDVATPIIQDLFNISKKDAGQVYYEAIALQNQQQGNAWISPWPQYVTRTPARCTEANNTVTCSIGVSLGQQGGQVLILEQAIVNLDTPENASFIIGAYNPATNQRLGGNAIKPKAVIVPENDTLKKVMLTEPGIEYELFIGEVDSSYRAVIASTELTSSIFTRLFFFDGAYTNNFELFSDQTSPITGDRITIWKVDWE